MSITCTQCKADTVTCDDCGSLLPITDMTTTSVGHRHWGFCQRHGEVFDICPGHVVRTSAEMPKRYASFRYLKDPIPRPVSDPIMDGIKERADHFNKSVTTAAVISLCFGFLLGAAVGLAVASFYVSKYCSLAS